MKTKQLASEYRLPREVIEQIDLTAERLKLCLVRVASDCAGLPQAHQAFDELVAIATHRPERPPPRDASLAAVGVATKAANYFEEKHGVVTIGDLVRRGPITVADARQMTSMQHQAALLTVIDWLCRE